MRSVLLRIWAAVTVLAVLVFLDLWLVGSLAALIVAASHSFPPDLAGWQDTWLSQPMWTAAEMLQPTTPETAEIAAMWRHLQPLALVGISFIAWKVLQWRRRLLRTPTEASDYGSHGTARWATAAERRRLLRADGPGLLLGQAGSKWWRHQMRHDGPLNDFVILFGPSKSGKSSRYVIPNMVHESEASVITTDPKGELYRLTAAAMERKGYQVAVINLKDPDRSMRYNPLDYCRKAEDVIRLVDALVRNTDSHHHHGDPFWSEAEQAVLASLVLYVLHERPAEERHLASVLRLATTVAREAEDLDTLFDALPPGHPALESYNIFRVAAAADRMRAGILTGAAVRLRLWAAPAVAALTAASDFDLRDLGRRRLALYLILRDDTAAYAPLTSLLFAQAIQELYREADAFGGRLPVPIRLRLDEAANIGAIPEFSAKVATMRSRGLSPEIILQDLGQLQRLYPNSWSTILANCDVQVVFGINDALTARYISEKLGTKTIQTASVGHSQSTRGGGISENLHYTGRPLMTPDEVMRLSRDELIVFLAGQHPFLLQKVAYTAHPEAADLMELDPAAFRPPLRGRLVCTDPEAALGRQLTAPSEAVPDDRDPLSFLDR